MNKIHFVEELTFSALCQQNYLHKMSLLEACNNKNVLDIGCATGFFSDLFAANAKSVVGIDISKENINVANKLRIKNNIKFIKMDASSLKFKKNSFDIIFCCGVLEHIQDLQKFFNSIENVLINNGLLVLMIGSRPKKIYPLIECAMNIAEKPYHKSHPEVHKHRFLCYSDVKQMLPKKFKLLYYEKFCGIIGIFLSYSLILIERLIEKLTNFKPTNIGSHLKKIDSFYMKIYIEVFLPAIKYCAKKDFLKNITNRELIMFELKRGT